jgi:hypothetical protein
LDNKSVNAISQTQKTKSTSNDPQKNATIALTGGMVGIAGFIIAHLYHGFSSDFI